MIFLLAGCASDPLAEQYRDGSSKNYISGDGTITEVAAEQRGEPVVFEGTTDAGLVVSNEDYAGDVLVVNFWYAACAPCRLEAPDLQELNAKYSGAGASFLGVNIYDQPDTALAFARKFDITYPSVIDADTGSVRLAFAGDVPPSAVPTTLVLDKKGRVAARFLGMIEAPSSLDTIIRELVAEEM
ncbi:MAG: alkyl hydroperoxide reductase [Homoserinimonas sp.]|jgi:thiol-disulfide isomerase/thioredoxin|nr:alkyl hydroperoxide reductase [Homoserinimonas sp.]